MVLVPMFSPRGHMGTWYLVCVSLLLVGRLCQFLLQESIVWIDANNYVYSTRSWQVSVVWCGVVCGADLGLERFD